MMTASYYLMIIYLMITTAILWFSKNHEKPKIIKRYCFINLWIILGFACGSNQPTNYKVLLDWMPLLAIPLLHRETEFLTKCIHQHSFDTFFIGLEKKYFPSILKSYQSTKNSKLISEIIHFCYLTFYFFIFGVPMYYYLTHNDLLFAKSTFLILSILLSCYLTNSLIPVCGPRNIYQKINDARSEGMIFKFVHHLLQEGSTHGTAFPSGHTAIAAGVILFAWYFQPTMLYVVLPFGIGIIISTIYGRFHYMLDLIFGLIYALGAFLLTLSVFA